MSISFALPEGRLFKDARNLFLQIGYEIPIREGRELLVEDSENKFIFSKPFDVPIYVEHGIDIGICGSDVVEERDCDLFIPVELPFGKCRMSVIGPESADYSIEMMEGFRVCSKYPKTTSAFFSSLGINVEILKLFGAVELGPRTGISDIIVDIVDSGQTIRENGLKEIFTISQVNAVLLVNRVSLKTKFSRINEIIDRIKENLGIQSGFSLNTPKSYKSIH